MLNLTQRSNVRRFLKPRLLALGGFASAGLLLAYVPVEFFRSVPTLGWALDLAVHWQWQYAVLASFAFMALGLLCGPRIWLAGLCLGALPFFSAVPELQAAADAKASLRVASLNLNLDNTEFAQALAWVDTLSPDVVVLQEVTPEMTALMAQMRGRFSFYSESARAGAFGSAVYSRHPISSISQEEWGGQGAVTYFEMHWNGVGVPVAAVHPFPPLTPQDWLLRDELLKKAAARAGAGTKSVVVGDFNASPWSSGLREATRRGLRRASGLAPTHSLWGGLPIDHVLADSTSWRVAARGVGPAVGSDHRPVWADLALSLSR